MKKIITEFCKDIKSPIYLEVPEGFEPSTFSSVARRSNPIELWDRSQKNIKENAYNKAILCLLLFTK